MPTCSPSRTTLSNPELPFRVFFCPDYPLSAIPHNTTPRPEREPGRVVLARDIAARGLLNPLIILNHSAPKYRRPWLMVGQNRLWALKSLGWDTAPAIVTGSSPFPAQELDGWESIRALFRDGEPYRSPHGIAMRGNAPLTSFGD